MMSSMSSSASRANGPVVVVHRNLVDVHVGPVAVLVGLDVRCGKARLLEEVDALTGTEVPAGVEGTEVVGLRDVRRGEISGGDRAAASGRLPASQIGAVFDRLRTGRGRQRLFRRGHGTRCRRRRKVVETDHRLDRRGDVPREGRSGGVGVHHPTPTDAKRVHDHTEGRLGLAHRRGHRQCQTVSGNGSDVQARGPKAGAHVRHGAGGCTEDAPELTLAEIVTVLRRRGVGHLVHEPTECRGLAWLENDVEVEGRGPSRRAEVGDSRRGHARRADRRRRGGGFGIRRRGTGGRRSRQHSPSGRHQHRGGAREKDGRQGGQGSSCTTTPFEAQLPTGRHVIHRLLLGGYFVRGSV
jgi:hypothetical protein